MNTPEFHIPVMLGESLQFWANDPNGFYVDLTLGMGGHTEGLLKTYPAARVLGFEWDLDSLNLARRRLEPFGSRFEGIHQNFAMASEELKKRGIRRVNGFLFDLGFSSYQMLHASRGLSFQKEEPLDMRLSRELLPYTAASFLKNINEEQLIKVFVEYGEIPPPMARRAARSLASFRAKFPLVGTMDLAKALDVGERKLLARLFQAIRIAVNAEMRNLEAMISQIWTFLPPGGRVAGISFHSLEDRIVKKAFQEREKMGTVRILTRKPLSAAEAEIRSNPKSRSAKLRAVEAVE